jgi:hypothetical protein
MRNSETNFIPPVPPFNLRAHLRHVLVVKDRWVECAYTQGQSFQLQNDERNAWQLLNW